MLTLAFAFPVYLSQVWITVETTILMLAALLQLYCNSTPRCKAVAVWGFTAARLLLCKAAGQRQWQKCCACAVKRQGGKRKRKFNNSKKFYICILIDQLHLSLDQSRASPFEGVCSEVPSSWSLAESSGVAHHPLWTGSGSFRKLSWPCPQNCISRLPTAVAHARDLKT